MRRESASRPNLVRQPAGEKKPRRWGLALLALAGVAGVALERVGLLDWHAGVALAQGYADQWWLAPALALATAGLFAAGLPGSMMVWVVGILLPPAVAVPVFVAGGVVGSLGARGIAAIAGGAREAGADEGRLLQILSRRSDFATLLAVRTAPGFPHSAINLAAGILGVPWGRFLAATALGLATKGTLYILAIHQATLVASLEDAISWRTLAPLAGLSILLLVAPPLVRRLRGPREPEAVPVEPA